MNTAQTRAPVSVIIPCYRCASTIKRTVDSIFAQSVTPSEVILVEDFSQDGTLATLLELDRSYPTQLKIVQMTRNQGAASARNAGWAVATQPYIAFLDADDAWHPNKIEIQYAYMRDHPEVSLSGHHYRIMKHSQKLPYWEIDQFLVQPISKNALLMSNRLITPSVMLKRDVLLRFKEGKRHVDDHLLWLELICEGHQIVRFSAELVAVYKSLYGASGLSSQLWLMEKSELENYKYLYKNGCINLPQWLSLTLYSVLKCVRRLIIYWSYLRWTN
jgi:glycosyltransferase involved in cell wall biosynthesis